MTKAELEPYLTREEVCRMLKVSLTTLWRWNPKGVLTNFKVGERGMRYLRTDVESFILSEEEDSMTDYGLNGGSFFYDEQQEFSGIQMAKPF